MPAEVLKRLPSLIQPPASLYTATLARGTFRNIFVELHIVPLDKPNRDPTLFAPKRPISFPCTMAEILEAVVLIRLQPKLE